MSKYVLAITICVSVLSLIWGAVELLWRIRAPLGRCWDFLIKFIEKNFVFKPIFVAFTITTIGLLAHGKIRKSTLQAHENERKRLIEQQQNWKEQGWMEGFKHGQLIFQGDSKPTTSECVDSCSEIQVSFSQESVDLYGRTSRNLSDAFCNVVYEGSDVVINAVAVSGTAPFTYQWCVNGINIDGATSSTLTKKNITTNDAGVYTSVVSDSAGNETSVNTGLLVQ